MLNRSQSLLLCTMAGLLYRSARLARGAQRDPETARALSGKRRAPPGTSVSGTLGKGRRRVPRPRPLSRSPAAPPRVPAAVLCRSLPPLSLCPSFPPASFSPLSTSSSPPRVSLSSVNLSLLPPPHSILRLYVSLSLCIYIVLSFSPSFYVFLIYIFFSFFLCISNLSLVLFFSLSLRRLYCSLPPSSLPFPVPPSTLCAGGVESCLELSLCARFGEGLRAGTTQLAAFPTCASRRARAHIHTHCLSLSLSLSGHGVC